MIVEGILNADSLIQPENFEEGLIRGEPSRPWLEATLGVRHGAKSCPKE